MLTSGSTGLDYDEMELTLGLPGEPREKKFGTKRQFSNLVDLKLGNSGKLQENGESDGKCSDLETIKHSLKGQVVGWPPLRSQRKNTMKNRNRKYIKVAVDGAPYLRKVDLESYTHYQQLLRVIEEMFTCFTIGNVLNEKNMMDGVKRFEHVPTYEDKDGDWMLVGDVPWTMFVETCRRIRLVKRSEVGNQLAP